MKRRIRHIALITALILGCTLQAQDLISFYDGENLYLRWKGIQKADLKGYTIYEKEGSDWKQIGTTDRIEENKDLDEVLGAKKELFLKLVGAESAESDFTQGLYNALIQNNEAYQFLGAMSVMNAEIAEALGDLAVVSTSKSGSIEIKISARIGSAEEEYIVTTVSLEKQKVPTIYSFSGEAQFESIQLQWDKNAIESEYVVGYRIYRSESPIGPFTLLNPTGTLDLSGNGGSGLYLDNYLEANTRYYYYITQFNAFGIESERSTIIEIKASAFAAARRPVNFGIRDRKGTTFLSWSADSQRIAIYRSTERNKGYELVFPASELVDFRGNEAPDISAQEGQYYYYYLKVQNNNGSSVAYSDTLGFALDDLTAPTAPQNVKGEVDKNGLVKLVWDPNPETDVIGYEVERYTGDSGVNNYLLNPKLLENTRFEDNLGARSQSAYRYVVYAVDASYNRSPASEPIRLRRPDDIPPQKPIITYIVLDNSELNLKWTRNLEDDLDHYLVYTRLEGEEWTSAKVDSNQIIQMLEVEGIHEICVSAVDGDGNESEKSVAHKVNHQPEREIGPPTNGLASDSLGGILLTWDESEDERTVGYLIERYDEKAGYWQLIVDLKGENSYFLDRYANAGDPQQYRVRAHDEDWYESEDLLIKYEPQ